MFLVRWFKSILSFLGLLNKSGTVLFLGLDNAGKTTLLHTLKDDRKVQAEPTLQPTEEELEIGSMRFLARDMGGHAPARRNWANYFEQSDAIVFIVDTSDEERIPEAKIELDQLLKDQQLEKVPFLILGNKIDVASIDEEELKYRLGLSGCTTGKGSSAAEGARPLEVFMCSIKEELGYAEGFQWLANMF